MAKVGIDVLKRDLTILAVIAMELDKAKEDGKINPIEWVKVGLKGVKLIEVAKTIKQAKAEYMDLDGAEKEELSKHIAETLDLRNDQTEALVEELLIMAVGLSGAFSVLEKVVEEKKQEKAAKKSQ